MGLERRIVALAEGARHKSLAQSGRSSCARRTPWLDLASASVVVAQQHRAGATMLRIVARADQTRSAARTPILPASLRCTRPVGFLRIHDRTARDEQVPCVPFRGSNVVTYD